MLRYLSRTFGEEKISFFVISGLVESYKNEGRKEFSPVLPTFWESDAAPGVQA